MKNLIAKLNKAFESRVRLGIMAALMVNDTLDFNNLKDLLELTDGNLASHLKALENFEYIRSSKQFIGRKPNTQYVITQKGAYEFKNHLDALGNLIQ
jgi:DNA-binding HxlR family transcriptional regulator